MNYYQHHIGDYRRDTAHLSLLEHGVYRQLLDWYYLSEEPIPEQTDLVIRRLCARTEEEKAAIILILGEFFKCDSGWVHARCDREISAYKAKADRARENGKLGGRKAVTKAVISGNQEASQSKANHKPLTINQEPVTNKYPAAAIAQAWHPTEETFRDLKLIHGYAEEWVLEQIPSFVAYWLDRGEARTSWNAIFIQHCESRAKLKMVAK